MPWKTRLLLALLAFGTVAGYGSALPIGDNAAEDGRALNRRIEIRIVRPGE
ncbi:MAG: hypothetical protein ACO33A_06000 [Hyphomonas sp.]